MKSFAICMALALMASPVLAGPKMEISDDSWLQLAFLGQAHYSFLDNAADEDDFYLRRGRIILQGQMMDGVKFFIETDNDNAGKNGSSASTDIQDAWMDVRVVENDDVALWVQGGLILLPFSFENRSSAASLLGIDYNAEACGKFVNSFVWRDYGAEIHGHILKRVAYRAGVFDGYDRYATSAIEKNDDAPLRYTGHVAVNVIGDVEKGGWFYTGNRLGKKGTYVAIGAGIDSQSDATATIVDTVDDPTAVPVEQDSDAWVVDLQSSFDLGDTVDLLINGAYYDWDNAAYDGNTAFVEAGVLVGGKAMLTGKYSLQDPENGDETEDFTVGLHYFMKGHNARAGIEYRSGDSDDWTLFGIQFLL